MFLKRHKREILIFILILCFVLVSCSVHRSVRSGENHFRSSFTKNPSFYRLTGGDPFFNKIALQVASTKARYTEFVGSQQYLGIYNGSDPEGCDLVSVLKDWDINLKNSRKDIVNFRLCDGHIKEILVNEVEAYPSEIERQILYTAHQAKLYGYSESRYLDYRIIAVPLRDFKKCIVEVKVLEGIKLIVLRSINVCK